MSTELTLDTLERKLSLVAPRLARRRGRGLDVVLSLAHDGVGGTRICSGGWVDGNRIKSDRSERGRGFDRSFEVSIMDGGEGGGTLVVGNSEKRKQNIVEIFFT